MASQRTLGGLGWLGIAAILLIRVGGWLESRSRDAVAEHADRTAPTPSVLAAAVDMLTTSTVRGLVGSVGSAYTEGRIPGLHDDFGAVIETHVVPVVRENMRVVVDAALGAVLTEEQASQLETFATEMTGAVALGLATGVDEELGPAIAASVERDLGPALDFLISRGLINRAVQILCPTQDAEEPSGTETDHAWSS